MSTIQAAHWTQQSFASQATPFGVQAPLQVAQMLPGGQPVIWGQANLFHSPATGQQQWAFVPAQTVGMGAHPIPAAVLQGLVPIAAMRPHSCEPPEASSSIMSPQHFVDSKHTLDTDPQEESIAVHICTSKQDTAQPSGKQIMDCTAELDFSQMKLTSGSSIPPSPTDSCEFKTLRPMIDLSRDMHYSYSFDYLSIGATPGPEQDTMSPSTEPLRLAAEDSSVNETEVLVMFVSQEFFFKPNFDGPL